MSTTFLFGAGASMDYLPTQAALVKDLQSASHPKLIPAQRYVRRFFGGLPADAVTFEEIVGPIEVAETDEHWFHLAGRRQQKLLTNREVLRSLDFWLAMALDPHTLPRYPKPGDAEPQQRLERYRAMYGPRADSPLAYASLLHHLRAADELQRTNFISLNYDLLLDRACLASGIDVDYAIDSFADDAPGEQRQRLLKLHGSLNWSLCEECHVLRNVRSRCVWPGNECSDCGRVDSRGPLLIRPTVLKDFRRRLWQEMWRTAGHLLRDSDRWVIVGYSLPFADVWILRLLMQSSISRGDGVDDREVYVVNPDESALQRFRGLFPRAQLIPSTFGEWVDEIKKGPTSQDARGPATSKAG